MVNKSNIDIASVEVLKEKILGLDCEYYWDDCTDFSEGKLSLLQIASKNRAWIFDCIDLLNEPKFVNFFKILMNHENILKIGHTFKGDIQVFGKTFNYKIN